MLNLEQAVAPHLYAEKTGIRSLRLFQCVAALLLLSPCALAVAALEVPNTLEEAYRSLDASLKPEERLTFMRQPEREAVVRAHFSLGLYIRNEWLRSGKSSLAGLLLGLGAGSFDDMSSMILTSYWRHLNGKPIELAQQGACFKRWWLEQQKLIDESTAKGEDSYSTPDFDCPP